MEVCPTTGTPHLQIYMALNTCMRLPGLLKIMKSTTIQDRAHWERVRSVEHAKQYCMKTGTYQTSGQEDQQGKRSDLEAACSIVISSGVQGVVENMPALFVKYHRGLDALSGRMRVQQEAFLVPKVYILWGDSGAGKTRAAYDMDPTLFPVPVPWVAGGQVWFDGYEGQKTLLFDEFDGWAPYKNLLMICDGRPMKVPVKGGHAWKNWDKVIICSNYEWRTWWPFQYEKDNCVALKRRVTEIWHFGLPPSGIFKTYPPTGVSVSEVG